jgi:hypothetical protein
MDSYLKNIDIQSEIKMLFRVMKKRKNSGHVIALGGGGKAEKHPRRPRKGNSLSVSVFRPQVLASERVLRWISPHSVSFRHSLSLSFPSANVNKMFEVMALSLDGTTRSGYGAGLLRFSQFCDGLHIDESDRMPASEFLLAMFAADAAGRVSSSAVDTWFSGLRFWHVVNGAEWHGSGLMVTQMRKGVRKLVPASARRRKRPPVTIEHMYVLRKGLDLTNSFDAAVWAVACIAFWSCCRLGELTIPSVNGFDMVKHVARSADLSFSSINDTRYASLRIPWTKTTQIEGAVVSITARRDPSCPVAALEHHLLSNSSVPGHAAFFAFGTASGSWAPMTRGWFMARCNNIWSAAGLSDMLGHGFRIGGATHLLLLGVAPDIVATQGRWLSRAFLDYWRQIESILPLFMSCVGVSSRVDAVLSAMDSFRRKHNL